MAVLEYQLEGNVGLVTLNRPEARNSLSPELIVALAEIWESIKADSEVRVVVLTGADNSTFCSSRDLENHKTNLKKRYPRIKNCCGERLS